MKRTLLTVSIAVLSLILSACVEEGGGPDPASAVNTTEVFVVDNRFEPEAIEIATGDTVTWTWEGSAPHDVDGDGFQSEVQTEGTFQHTFDSAGKYPYVCNIHPGMTGLVVVTEQ